MQYLRLVVLLLLSSCATEKVSDYQKWVAQPTPRVWEENQVWRIVMLDKSGSTVRELTLKFTDETAETCSSGEFKKIEILSEQPERSDLFLGLPAYSVKGSALIIDLSANLCDASYELRGKLSEDGIEGYHQPVSMFGGEVVGRFYGSPAEHQQQVNESAD